MLTNNPFTTKSKLDDFIFVWPILLPLVLLATSLGCLWYGETRKYDSFLDAGKGLFGAAIGIVTKDVMSRGSGRKRTESNAVPSSARYALRDEIVID